jgi:proline-specific peptidase
VRRRKMSLKVQEGYIPFAGYKTYYRIVGECDTGRLPILALHGGPGSAHYYVTSLDDIAERYGRAVIYYDQMSCGKSKSPALPDQWSAEFFEDELRVVRRELGLDRIHLWGHSWGGMLAMQYATHRPAGIASMVVASGPASLDLWLEEANRLRGYLPVDMQKALVQADEDGDYERPEVKAASDEYYRRHVCKVSAEDEDPKLRRPKDEPGKECYHFMQGMSEFVVTGKLSHWDITADLHRISIPTLFTSGEADECTPYIAKQVVDRIPGCEWHLFRGGTHCVHSEQPQAYNDVVEEFVERHE